MLDPEIIEFITSKDKHDKFISNYIFGHIVINCYFFNPLTGFTDISIKKLHQTIISMYPLWKNKNSYEKPYYNNFISSYYPNNFKTEKLEIIFKKLIEIINQSQFKHVNNLSIFFLSDFEECQDMEERLDKLKILASRLTSTSACQSFISWFYNLKNLDYLLTLSNTQLENFLEIFPQKSWDLDRISLKFTIKEYEIIQLLSQRKDIPLYILKKWMNVVLIACNLKVPSVPSIIGFYNTHALFQLISSFIDEKTYFDEKEFDQLIIDINNFKTNSDILLNISNCFNKLFFNIRNKHQASINEYKDSNQRLQHIFQLIQENNNNQLKTLPGCTLEKSIEIEFHLWQLQQDAQKNNTKLKEMYRFLGERGEYISTTARPFIYALLLPESEEVMHKQLTLPVTFEEKDFSDLHQDSAVIQEIGSADLAAIRIQGAINQTNRDYFFIREILKNSHEAGATQVEMHVYAEQNKSTTLLIKDNGTGMDLEGLKALRIPGYTTKRKELKDPNFGWGFFTIFRDFDEATILSSVDGTNVYYLNLRKTGNKIEMQIKTEIKKRPIGTTIVLRKKQSNPLVDLVKIKSEVVSSCQYMQGLKILFQGTCMNNEGEQTILAEEKADDLHVQVGFGDEGIYCKNIRMGDLTAEAFSYLPESLKNFLAEKHCKIRLFIPHSEQIMNRGYLIEQEGFLETIQFLVFKSAMKAYVKYWTQDFSVSSNSKDSCFNIFSHDYWNDFRCFQQPIDESLQPAFDFMTKNNAVVNFNDLKTTDQAIYQHAIDFFIDLKHNTLNLSQKDEGTLEDILAHLSKKNRQISLSENLKQLSVALSDSTQFASLISFLPLNGYDSFRTIRNNLIAYLISQDVLDQNGDYRIQWIENKNSEEIKELIEIFIDELRIDSEDSDNILNNFQHSITNCLIAMKTQQNAIINQSQLNKTDLFKQSLKAFLEKAANQLWNQQIEIEFYLKADGSIAYTHPGSKIIYVNSQSKQMDAFMRLYFNDNKQSLNSFDHRNFSVLMDWIETLAHELTHIQESSDCQSTHDANFRKKIADFLLKTFIQKDDIELPIWEIFKSVVALSAKPPAKRHKKEAQEHSITE